MFINDVIRNVQDLYPSEYVLAKICYFQRDLSAYRDWLIKRMPSGDNRIRNWW